MKYSDLAAVYFYYNLLIPNKSPANPRDLGYQKNCFSVKEVQNCLSTTKVQRPQYRALTIDYHKIIP